MHTDLVNKNNFNKKSFIIYVISVVMFVALPIITNRFVFDKKTVFTGEGASYPATVTEIVYNDTFEHYDGAQIVGTDETVVFKCKITDGEFKGKEVVVTQENLFTEAVTLDTVNVGDRIMVMEPFEDQTYSSEYDSQWLFTGYNRTLPLIVLAVVFAVLLILFGRTKGLKTLVTLSMTCYAVFLVFVPSILSGHNPYLWSVLCCIYIIIMTLVIVNGYSKKTLAAIIGCASGVAAAGILVLILSKFLHLTGVAAEDMTTVTNLKSLGVNLKSLTFAGIILGSLGAVMDVSVSISSSLKEIHDQVEAPTLSGLIKSGITIGRDIMGTMANTLVLAYIGCEVATTVILLNIGTSLVELFSTEYVVTEVLQMLVGSIGILLTIPLTAIVSAALYMGKPKFQFKRNVFKPAKDKYYVEPPEEPGLFDDSGNINNLSKSSRKNKKKK